MDEREANDVYKAYAAQAGDRRMVQILRPFAVLSKKTYSAPVTLPIGSAYLAAVLEQAGYRTGIIDAIGEDIHTIRPSPCGNYNIQGLSEDEIVERIDRETLVLGLSLMFSQDWLMHRRLIRAIHRAFPKLIIVVGGEHPTAMPEFVLKECPAINTVVLGEGEMTFLELVHCLFTGRDATDIPGTAFIDKRGSYVAHGLSRRIAHIDSLPRPAWHLCPAENYFIDNWTMGIAMGRNMPILATRGCPYQCAFCSNPTMWTTRYTMRNVAEVVDEIQFLIGTYRANSIDFFDLTAIIKKEWILDFCRELKRRGINVTWQLPSGTRSEALDGETLAALKDTGCGFLVYAPESGSERSLRIIKKKIKLARITDSIRKAVKVGLTVKINFIVGFPDETWLDVFKTLAYSARLAVIGADDCNISVFTPYPGSEFFDLLRERGVIKELDDDYFAKLIAQFDMFQATSYCHGVPGWGLVGARLFGHVLFYSLAYLLHPTRIIRLARSLLNERFRPANLFEQRLSDMRARARNNKGMAPKASQ